MNTTTTTASVTFVCSRFSKTLRLRVNGKSAHLGAERFVSPWQDAESSARAVLNAEAARRGLSVVSTELLWSDTLNAQWTLRAVFGNATA